MASKVEQAKSEQGYTRNAPVCGNCAFFKSKKEEVSKAWTTQKFIVESELRCGVGSFKVNKTAWCEKWQRKSENE